MNAIPSALLVLGVSSGAANTRRRQSLRNSWFGYLAGSNSILTQQQKDQVLLKFLVSNQENDVEEEQEQHGDMLLLDAPEGYHMLWRKALVFFESLEKSGVSYDYVMHADDDSFVRLDLLLPLLDKAPRQRFYWGYIWDGTGARKTTPIRKPQNKSYMPVEQYPMEYYPPFASGCGFILSKDLIQALLAHPLPDYRLLDPPFGIHLCGGPRCVITPPIVPIHDERVRPYRPLPTFRPDTIVQHYLQPEEMRPYYQQALTSARGLQDAEAIGTTNSGHADTTKNVSSEARDAKNSSDGLVGNTACDEGSLGAGSASCSNQRRAETDSSQDCTPAEYLYKQLVALGLLRR